MNLNEKPATITWPKSHYIYVQKDGPFEKTAQKCWKEFHKLFPKVTEQGGKMKTMTSLYKIEPKMIYRAGATLDSKPKSIPKGLQYFEFAGGKYYCFVLKGSYSALPEACGRVFEIVEEKGLKVRADFYLENYVNDPFTTEEKDLITEILIPAE